MSAKAKWFLGALVVATCLCAWHDVEAQYTYGVACDNPYTGTCTIGDPCPGIPGCTLTGLGSWSVCLTSPWYCWSQSPGCTGTTLGGTFCYCYGPSMSPSGC